jgi:hypothetical protein
MQMHLLRKKNQKNVETDKKSMIGRRILKSVGRIRGSGSVPKYHGSTTMLNGRGVRSILDFDSDKVIDYCYNALDPALSFSNI